MVSMRNDLARAARHESLHPAVRFVTDFSRLIVDVDRLMVDIGQVTASTGAASKGNGDGRRLAHHGTMSTFREHARSFVTSMRHFELLLDRVPVPFMELDENARILMANTECEELFNRTALSLRGKSLFSFLAGSDVKRLREHLDLARGTNKPCVVYLSFLDRGTTHPVELRLRRQFIGGTIGYVAALEPANHLQYVPAAVQQKEEHPPSIQELVLQLNRAHSLKSIGDVLGNYCSKILNSPAGIIVTSQNGGLQLVSQWDSRPTAEKEAVEAIIKGPVAKVFRSGKPVSWRPHGIALSKRTRSLFRLLRQCQCRSVMFLPIRAPGQNPAAVLGTLVHQGNGFPSAFDDFLELGQTVSECIARGRAYDEAIAARARAESAIQIKDEFLSVLSHELKNPMMPILGWAVALSSGTLPADKQNTALDGIVRNIRALNYLIEDLFDMVRISSGKLRLEPVEIRIQDVAREALTAIQHTAEGKKLRVSTDIAEGIPPFLADGRRLKQVLTNLLNNAVKFTPGGGSIALRVRRRGDLAECIVSDTGKGIDRKFLPFVFDSFRQENRSSKGHAGLGLGLAIVREIVELHGGSIKASSEGVDKGSTFTLHLPIRRKHSGKKTLRRKK